MKIKKCERCLGQGFWHVFSDNTVNGLEKQTCDNCKEDSHDK